MMYVKDENKKNVKILLDRRAELKEQINKCQAEYTAIGKILEDYFRLAEEKTERKISIEEMDRIEREDMGYGGR